MKEQIVERAKMMSEAQKIHIRAAAMIVLKQLTNDEIRQFSDDVGGRALVNGATRIITGKHHLTGADRTPIEKMDDLSGWKAVAETYIFTIASGQEWRG